MNWPPKITIVTPSYNQARYLDQTIMSVLGQGYPNLEYIVIDGGSKDGSVEIIKKYAEKLTYWHSIPDQGQADAINQGLKMAKGELCAYINSDDKLIEGSLWKMAYLAKEYPECDIFFGANHMFFETGGVVYKCPRPVVPGKGYGYIQDASFWRTNIHQNIGYLDVSYQFGLCLEFFLRAILNHSSLFHSEQMSIIRDHALSKTSTLSDVSKSDFSRICKYYGDFQFSTKWQIRAFFVGLLSSFTSWVGRYWLKPIWRIKMPPLTYTKRII
jgi:glycosyltransferase involved in cell wall biosynthesis